MRPDSIDEARPARDVDAMSGEHAGSEKPAAAIPMTVTAKPTFWNALKAALGSWWGTGPTVSRKQSSDELAEDRTDMAGTRTLMAADRTLMAWVRTSLSLNSFGFTIYKVLQGLSEAGISLRHGQSPLEVGLFLTGLGTVAMVMGTIEYAQTLRDLHIYMEIKLRRPAFIMALLMSVFGLFLFFNIVARLF